MASAGGIPPAFKSFISALRRAEELEKDVDSRESQILAYYCRLYVVTKITLQKLANSSDEQTFLLSQVELLERQRPKLNLQEGEGQRVCTEKALEVFNKADEIDRLGLADKSTAKIFYSAGTFFEILEQFGDLSNDIQERKKYAKWKATEIVNAINMGEIPQPGGFGEAPPTTSGNMSPPSAAAPPSVPMVQPTSPAVSHQSSHVPTPSAPPTMTPPVTHFAPPVGHQTAAVPPVFNPSKYTRAPASSTDPRVKDAVELCNFAISALKFNEISLAKERLQEALRRLG